MTTHNFLTRFSTHPIYNTKAVAQETGIPADTFRAWERRYGIPQPHRTEGGHRLYSERDIVVIRWLRDRTAEGLTISQAIALMDSNSEPHLSWIDTAVATEPQSWHHLSRRLLAALCDYDERRANQILGEAFAIYPLDDVLLSLITPTLMEVGEQWHQGKINVATEHFASQFLRRKIFSIFHSSAVNDGRGLILVGCVPGELHEIGALIFATILVRHGWQVVYLGAQVPLPDLMESIQHVRPDMVCLSATLPEAAHELVQVGEAIASLSPPRPLFGYGGQACEQDEHLRARVQGIFLGTAREAIDTVNEVLHITNRTI